MNCPWSLFVHLLFNKSVGSHKNTNKFCDGREFYYLNNISFVFSITRTMHFVSELVCRNHAGNEYSIDKHINFYSSLIRIFNEIFLHSVHYWFWVISPITIGTTNELKFRIRFNSVAVFYSNDRNDCKSQVF